MSIGWGIVGTGKHAGTMMAPAIAAVDGARLVGVVSRDQGRADDFAREHGAEHGWTRYEDLLASPDVDAVLITSPSGHHADQVVAAAQAGKHVFCDKPLALDAQDAARAVDACREAGVRLGVDFQMRHTEWAARARALIESGAIGDVIAVQAEHAPGVRGKLMGWRSDPSLAGLGAVNNIAVHVYDLLRFLLGAEATEVSAMFDTGTSGELELIALTLLRFDNGTLAYVNANQVVPKQQNDIDIYGTEGRIVGVNLTRHMQRGQLRVIAGGEDEQIAEQSTDAAFQRSVADFTDAVANGREPLATGTDGLRSVQLTDAIARSAREGRVVQVGY